MKCIRYSATIEERVCVARQIATRRSHTGNGCLAYPSCVQCPQGAEVRARVGSAEPVSIEPDLFQRNVVRPVAVWPKAILRRVAPVPVAPLRCVLCGDAAAATLASRPCPGAFLVLCGHHRRRAYTLRYTRNLTPAEAVAHLAWLAQPVRVRPYGKQVRP